MLDTSRRIIEPLGGNAPLELNVQLRREPTRV
jgi:hypothetical protein